VGTGWGKKLGSNEGQVGWGWWPRWSPWGPNGRTQTGGLKAKETKKCRPRNADDDD
jgi:hypothetical protein